MPPATWKNNRTFTRSNNHRLLQPGSLDQGVGVQGERHPEQKLPQPDPEQPTRPELGEQEDRIGKQAESERVRVWSQAWRRQPALGKISLSLRTFPWEQSRARSPN